MNKKLKVFLIILAIIMLLVILLSGSVAIWLFSKFKKINFKYLDNSDLGINYNLYENVSNIISESEYNSIINILLIGSDSDNTYDAEQHSDVIMILSINTVKKSVKIISIPRDTAVDIPNYGRFKLNKTYALGEEQLLIKTINTTFDLNIDKYVTVDFKGLIDIINQMGGIEMDITSSEMQYINRGLKDMYKLSNNDYETLKSYGKVTLNGEQAMVHARNRTVGNDFTRSERHRDIIEAIISKMSTMTEKQVLNLSDSLLDDVKTNVNIMEYVPMLPGFIINKNSYLSNVNSVMVPSLEYSKGVMYNGAYLVETDLDRAKADFIKYMYEL